MTTASEVREILRYPLGRKWTIQGFGMLRLYLDDGEIGRLHIWDTKQMAVEDVSTVHDHPWDFDSRVISGRLHNQRYIPVGGYIGGLADGITEQWTAQPIRCGEGGHKFADPAPCFLRREPTEHYIPGDPYHQDAPEVHESLPSRGCVTVVKRTFSRERDIATSYYRDTPEWVSAEPRPATLAEVEHFTTLALEKWDG